MALNVDACLLTAMPFFLGDISACSNVSKVVVNLLVDIGNHGRMQFALVAFERQHKVSFGGDDLSASRWGKWRRTRNRMKSRRFLSF